MTPDDGGEQLWDSLTGDSEGDSEVGGSVGSPQQQSTDSELELQLQLEQLDWDSGFQPSTSQEWQGCAGWADAPPAAVLQLDSGSSGYASGDSSPSSCASSAVVCCDSATAVVDLAILAGAGSLGATSTSLPELPRGAWLHVPEDVPEALPTQCCSTPEVCAFPTLRSDAVLTQQLQQPLLCH